MQEMPGFSQFHDESLLSRFTAGIQGTHRHKSNVNLGNKDRFCKTIAAIAFIDT